MHGHQLQLKMQCTRYTVRMFNRESADEQKSSGRKASDSIHGVGRDNADGAVVDEVDDGVQLPEVLAGRLHLDPQHPAIPSLRARGQSSRRRRSRWLAPGIWKKETCGMEGGGGAP